MMKLFKCYFYVIIMYPMITMGQSLPATFDMSMGNSYSLNSYSQTNTNYPPNMVIRFCGDCNLLGNFTTDLTAEADHRAGGGAGQWRGENTNGVSVRGGTNKTRGSFLMILNTTSRSNINLSWTVRDIVTNPNTNYIEFQWRIGGSGAWNNVVNDFYQQGTTPSGTSYNISLPAAAENNSDLRIRWIYYETGNGARDRLAIDDILIQSDMSLPLYIVDFKVRQIDQSVQVEWMVANALDIDYFVVEESYDALHFYPIHTIPFNAEQNQLEYAYLQTKLAHANLYYRIHQVDMDGQSFYTDIRHIAVKVDAPIKIFPTIVKDHLFINIQQPTNVMVVDASGRILINQHNLSYLNPIDLSNLPSGIYYLQVLKTNQPTSLKFIKM